MVTYYSRQKVRGANNAKGNSRKTINLYIVVRWWLIRILQPKEFGYFPVFFV
ncbi:unnamed protein product [Meloidogyne enterolobii]|uniref:Uncharacterized protein n=1 Tax=Meloidogyne enterolobii TaxID=390850 RepID=A0ACB0Y2Z3_MELEN